MTRPKTNNLQIAVLIAVAFFVGQTFAQQHLHIDETTSANCVVCAHADNAPLAHTQPPSINQPSPEANYRIVQIQAIALQPRLTTPIRAPPTQ